MKKPNSIIERVSFVLTQKIGTPASLLLHTVFFVAMFLLPLFGVDFDKMMLLLTTIVSLEAIYLALFIQMTVNKASEDIEDVGEDLKDISEDIEDVGEDLKDISEDIDDIQEDDKEDDVYDHNVAMTLRSIEKKLQQLQKDVSTLKENQNTDA